MQKVSLYNVSLVSLVRSSKEYSSIIETVPLDKNLADNWTVLFAEQDVMQRMSGQLNFMVNIRPFFGDPATKWQSPALCITSLILMNQSDTEPELAPCKLLLKIFFSHTNNVLMVSPSRLGFINFSRHFMDAFFFFFPYHLSVMRL